MRPAYFVLTVVLALLASACAGGGSQATPLALGSAPWTDGERVTYNVLNQSGNQVGTAQFSFAKDGTAWVLGEVDDLPQVKQNAQVRVASDTLKPLGEDKTMKTAQAAVTLHTEYKDGKLNVTAKVNGQEKQVSIDVPADALDNDQVLMSLRALDFREGLNSQFMTVVGANVAKVPTTVRVIGKEDVQTPGGKIGAWKVELAAAQSKQSLWYEVAEPHRLLQYDNGGVKFVLAQ